MRFFPSRFFVIVLLMVGAVESLVASPDSTWADTSHYSYETVVFVGHLNFDCTHDTLIAVTQFPSMACLPDRIHWGTDTLPCSVVPVEPVTYLEYPDWEKLTGRSTVMIYNTDTIPDIIVHMSGQYGVSPNERDTSISIALFGQDYLTDLDTVSLSFADTLVETPFFGLVILKESRLLDSSVTDHSGFPSYFVPLVSLNVTGDTTQSILLLSSVEDREREETLRAEVIPNPTSGTTRISVHPLSPGSYHIEVVTSRGTTVYEEEVNVSSSGELFHPLDLSNYPSGYYHITIRHGETLVTTRALALIN